MNYPRSSTYEAVHEAVVKNKWDSRKFKITQTAITLLLLQYGANRDAKNKNEETPNFSNVAQNSQDLLKDQRQENLNRQNPFTKIFHLFRDYENANKKTLNALKRAEKERVEFFKKNKFS